MDVHLTDRLLERMLMAPPAPFTPTTARQIGLTPRDLRRLVRAGLLRRPVRGVYVPAHLPDSLALRLAVLSVVVPEDCVVTDRTAAWLWGADMALPPGSHLTVPPVSVFAPRNRRLRNGVVASGQRDLIDRDVAELDGVLVTSVIRTACDVGRLLPRYQAIGVMDALARVGGLDALSVSEEMRRFRGYRGVIQGRELASYVDAGADSPPESEARIRWIDLGLPKPRTQVPVPNPTGGWFYIDIGLEERRLGVEYFGEAFHGPQQQASDDSRIAWLTKVETWQIVVVRRRNLYGKGQDYETLLQRANQRALRELLEHRSVST